MPVIGRLDGQVDDVLIAPLERRRRGRDEPRADEPSEATADRDALEKRPSQDEPAKDAAHDEFERDAPREELPVWLL